VRRAAGELVLEAPPVELQDAVLSTVDTAVADLDCEAREVKLWKLGRHLTVRITLLVRDAGAPTTVAALDALRAKLWDALQPLSPALRVDVLFTADRRWLDAVPDAPAPVLPHVTTASIPDPQTP
jgi:predicted Co/Zn/Cd cation transporter (cation efflux family)